MKNSYKYLLISCLFLIALNSAATDWNDTKHMFRYKKDVDPTVSADYTRNMASVSYHDTIFNFVNYRSTGNGSITLRKIYNKDGTPPSFNWEQKKYDDITNLKELEDEDWQPAPVVFRDSLILFFVGNGGINGETRFSVYNPLNNSWSYQFFIPGANNGILHSHGMAAVVADDKLVLITHENNGKIEFHWTNELSRWKHQFSDETISSSDGENDVISAISAAYTDPSGKRRTKIACAYIDGSKHPRYFEYYFLNEDSLVKITANYVTTSDDYSSVTLAEGTISCKSGTSECVADPTSTGDCIQAFLKRDIKDNTHTYYRIKRCQLVGGIWSTPENNVVPQNDPYHMWASSEIPLSTATISVVDGWNIRQFMCLVYRGYDNWDYPMNVAWAETNKLIYNDSKAATQTLAGPDNTSYIGYIEGPPPYHLNNDTLKDPYITPSAEEISSQLFKTSQTTTNSSEMGYDVGGKLSLHAGFFKGSLSSSFGQIWGSEYSTTIYSEIELFAIKENYGYYISTAPVINLAYYDIYDVNNHLIDSTLYYYMSEPGINVETVELQPGLNPREPTTYYRRAGINFPSYNTTRFGAASVSWTGGTKVSSGITVDTEESKSNTIKAKLKLEAGLGELFKIGFDGSFDYTMTTTTKTGNETRSATRLNEPVKQTDVKKLNYWTYWIKPNRNPGINNWWLHPGAESQDTWCITYDVTYLQYKNDSTIGSPVIAAQSNSTVVAANTVNAVLTEPSDPDTPPEVPQNDCSFFQNYPNPFSSTTKLAYQVGAMESGGQPSRVNLVVYNMHGTVVATLADEVKGPGRYETQWNASSFSPGIYYARFVCGSYKAVKKLVLIK